MWAIIDVNKGEVIYLGNTKKECLEEAKQLRWLDKWLVLVGDRDCVHKYIVVKEEEI